MPSYRDVTVGHLLTELAAALPGNPALLYESSPRFTFAELEREARTIARGLMAEGVEPGERVVLWATNVPEWVVLQFALAKIGAILVTANTALRARDIDYLLRQSEAATLVTIRGFRDVDYVGVPFARSAPTRGRIDVAAPVDLHRQRRRRADSPTTRRFARAADVTPRGARRAQPPRRRRRRHQHAIHVGNHRVSQRRDAVEPQHRQQRLGARRGTRATRLPIACACACRCFTASAA